MTELIPPSMILIFGSLLLPFLRGKFYILAVIMLPLAALFYVMKLPAGASITLDMAAFDIGLIEVWPYSKIFGAAFCLAALGGGIFGLRAKRSEIAAAYVYAGSALGCVYAGNLITLFIFWELMLIGSLIVLWHGGTEASRRAGMRYAIMHLLGGTLLLAGIIAHAVATGSFAFYHLALDQPADWLILVGILVNAGGPIVSAWVADSYPESSPAGGVFLSAFTTKTAVFVLITLAPGNDILIWAGLWMVFYGIIYAMLENDARRILSYSIVNQVGFMVTAVGIGTPLALMGAATHAFCHIIYKGLLFMSAGAVLHMTGKRKCTDLGGLYRTMRFTTLCGIVGALSISAFPLTSGFVSKSLTQAAAAESHLITVWYLLLAASAGVFLHAGVKFPWFVFFHRDSGLRPKDPPASMCFAMLFFAALCILPGIFPQYLYALLPEAKVPYQAYTPSHVVTQLQLLLFAGLAFFVALPWLERKTTITLDFDWLWRVLLRNLLLWIEKIANVFLAQARHIMIALHKHVHHRVLRFFTAEGILAANWPIGTTALLLTGFLGIYLLYYYARG